MNVLNCSLQSWSSYDKKMGVAYLWCNRKVVLLIHTAILHIIVAIRDFPRLFVDNLGLLSLRISFLSPSNCYHVGAKIASG